MKKVLLFLSIFAFGIWGCSENTNLTGPEKIDSQQTILKTTSNSSAMLTKTTASKTINGDFGGLIPLNLESEDEETGAKGWLYLPRNSFDGEKTISVTVVDGLAALDFEPSGTSFELPAHLTVQFNGVEFDDDDTDDIDFQFIASDGSLVPVEYRKLIVNKKYGWVIVIDAKLEHFSRYGFTK